MSEPKLGGGLSPTEWLRTMAESDRKKGANARADEAERIALWIDELEGNVVAKPVRLDKSEQLASLLQRSREARTQTATIRLGQTRVRFPEISECEIKPLSDTELIIKALEREVIAMESALRDLQREKTHA
jgi:hypothetical protein